MMANNHVNVTDATNMDPLASLWIGEEDNSDPIGEACRRVFLSRYESLHIAKAIEKKLRVGEGSKELGAQKLRKIPKDYVPLNRASTLSTTATMDRWKKWEVILGVPESARKQTTALEVGAQDDEDAQVVIARFCGILDNLREIVIAMAGPIINTHFAVEFFRKFPMFTFGSTGRKVRKIEDFVDFIHQYDPNHDKMTMDEARAMTHFCIYPIFGKSNHWAEKGEREILELLGFEYDGNRMSDGHIKKRLTRGGFAKQLCVKKADQLRTKIIDAWARCFDEQFFSRDNYKPKKVAKNSAGNDQDTTPTVDAAGKGKGSKKGKHKPDKSALRKYIVTCRLQTHSFDGSYLLLDGHPKRKEIDGIVATKTREQQETEQKEFLITQLSACVRNSKRDLSSLWASQTGNDGDKLMAFMNSFIQGGGMRCGVTGGAPPVVHVPPNKKNRINEESEEPAIRNVSDDSSSETTIISSPGQLEQSFGPFHELTDDVVHNDLLGLDLQFHDPQVQEVKDDGVTGEVQHGQVGASFPGKAPRNGRQNNIAVEPTGTGNVDPKESPKSQPSTPKKGTANDNNTVTRTTPVKWKMPPLPEGMTCLQKNHDNPALYPHYGSNYFTSSERAKKSFLPKCCLLCKATFVWGKGKKQNNGENTYHVKNEIRACECCFSPVGNQRCNRAFCSKCHAIACQAVNAQSAAV